MGVDDEWGWSQVVASIIILVILCGVLISSYGVRQVDRIILVILCGVLISSYGVRQWLVLSW